MGHFLLQNFMFITHQNCNDIVPLCQGGLDVQYLASRYSRGKEAVAGFMEQRHVFANVKQITLAQGEIVEKQASLGRSLLLVGRDFVFHVFLQVKQQSKMSYHEETSI